MTMPQPRNSISMVGGQGPHGVIDMGGMVTIIEIRDKLADATTDPRWYQANPNETAVDATADELARDGSKT